MSNSSSLPLNLFWQGIETAWKKHRDEEEGKRGTLRAGNAGILLPDGTATGKCNRLSLLRHEGVDTQDEYTPSDELMFASGHFNESFWKDILKHSWTEGPILCEEEIPVAWSTAHGVKVTGRPDMVLCKAQGHAVIPQHLIEHKGIASLWTAVSVINGKPKLPHVIQAAHYAWQLGCPVTLIYTSYVKYAAGWAEKKLPLKGAPGSEHCEYNKYGKCKGTVPFVVAFDLRFETDGTVSYRLVSESDGKWNRSIVTRQSIENYYNNISAALHSNGELAPMVNLDVDGNREEWSLSDYCSLGDKCCQVHQNKSLKDWLQLINIKGENK